MIFQRGRCTEDDVLRHSGHGRAEPHSCAYSQREVELKTNGRSMMSFFNCVTVSEKKSSECLLGKKDWSHASFYILFFTPAERRKQFVSTRTFHEKWLLLWRCLNLSFLLHILLEGLRGRRDESIGESSQHEQKRLLKLMMMMMQRKRVNARWRWTGESPRRNNRKQTEACLEWPC